MNLPAKIVILIWIVNFAHKDTSKLPLQIVPVVVLKVTMDFKIIENVSPVLPNVQPAHKTNIIVLDVLINIIYMKIKINVYKIVLKVSTKTILQKNVNNVILNAKLVNCLKFV